MTPGNVRSILEGERIGTLGSLTVSRADRRSVARGGRARRWTRPSSHARHEFSTVRTGRASAGAGREAAGRLLRLEVPLQQLASFSVPEARLLVVNPFDKGSLSAIEKAIRNSDLGLNPTNDGVVIRLAFPPLTEERRKEFVQEGQATWPRRARSPIRNARRDARRELEALARDGDAGEDDVARAEKELDRITHGHEADIDEALEQKEAELLEV